MLAGLLRASISSWAEKQYRPMFGLELQMLTEQSLHEAAALIKGSVHLALRAALFSSYGCLPLQSSEGSMKVLVVEDDPLIQRSLCEMLEAWGLVCDETGDGETAWDLICRCPYDLILLDLNLPRLDGLALCRRIRSRGGPQPLILMLTARDSNRDRVVGLDDGADDYMVKPFAPDLLRARVQALLRRASRPLTRQLSWGALQLDRDGHGARYGGHELTLTATEHHLLEALLRAAGTTCSKEQLLEVAWNWADTPGSDSLRTHIKNLRAKLSAAGAPPDLVETVYGVGFRLHAHHAS
jgi:DNA-binding response OmpR family regulator